MRMSVSLFIPCLQRGKSLADLRVYREFPTGIHLISTIYFFFYWKQSFDGTGNFVRIRKFSENVYLMSVSTLEKPCPHPRNRPTPGVPRYFWGVSWRVLGVGRRVPSQFFADTQWRRAKFVPFSVEKSRRKSTTAFFLGNTLLLC